jgi:hypothetical protein
MLKLPLALLVLLGTCAAQDVHPLTQLQGTSRVLIVFAPDTNSAAFKRQLQLIERHGYELTQRNTVVMPVSLAGNSAEDHFIGENLPLTSTNEQADARTRFNVKPGEFLVVLLNQDGTEQIRSASPVDIHELTAKLDSMPRH